MRVPDELLKGAYINTKMMNHVTFNINLSQPATITVRDDKSFRKVTGRYLMLKLPWVSERLPKYSPKAKVLENIDRTVFMDFHLIKRGKGRSFLWVSDDGELESGRVLVWENMKKNDT